MVVHTSHIATSQQAHQPCPQPFTRQNAHTSSHQAKSPSWGVDVKTRREPLFDAERCIRTLQGHGSERSRARAELDGCRMAC
jgi:hypothetical protein